MATISWGTPTAWADVIATASINSLANGSTVFSGTLDNTAGYGFVEISFVGGGSITPTAGGNLGFYIAPQAHDGSSWPLNTTSGTALPSLAFLGRVVDLPTTAGVQVARVLIPMIGPGNFRAGMINRAGVALSASGNTLRYRLLNEQVA